MVILDTLKCVQILNDIEFNRIVTGGLPKRRKKNIDQERKIKRLWNMYNAGIIYLKELIDGLKGAI